jgi:hypothetical protein
LRRLTEEDGAKPKAAAYGFFDDMEAFNRTIARVCKFGVSKGLAHLLDQRIVAAFDTAQTTLQITSLWFAHLREDASLHRNGGLILLVRPFEVGDLMIAFKVPDARSHFIDKIVIVSYQKHRALIFL